MSIQRNTKAALAATLMGSLLLVACGGDSSSDNAANPTSVPATATPTTAPTVALTVAPTAEPTTAPTAEPTVAPTAEPTAAPTAEPTAVPTTEPTAAPGLVAKTWGFDSSVYATANTDLFEVAFVTGADNAIKAGVDATYDGLHFYSTAKGVLRFRDGYDPKVWNTNGSFFTSNATLLPAVNTAVDMTTVRTYLGIPVTKGVATTITVSYKQTSTLEATIGKTALIGDDNIVYAAKDAGYVASTGDSITFALQAGHALNEVRFFYSRENDTSKAGSASGGVNITDIVRQ